MQNYWTDLAEILHKADNVSTSTTTVEIIFTDHLYDVITKKS